MTLAALSQARIGSAGPRRIAPRARSRTARGSRAGGAPGPPRGPGRPRRSEGDADTPLRERGTATKTRERVARPPRFKVILYNDDYTPMEFVVGILERIFRKSPAEATALMLQIHRSGMGIGGVYVLEIAETKVAAVHRTAEENGFPLRAGLERE